MGNLQRLIIQIMDAHPEFDNIDITRNIGIKDLNNIEMTSQEATWYLLREPMSKSSTAIAKNEQAGIAHERDAEDRVKYEAAIREYEATSAAKSNQPQQQPQQQPKLARSSAKRNRSQVVSGRVAKRSKYSSTQGAGGPSTSAAGAASRAAYSEVARDHLQVALVDAKTNSGRAVLPLWDAIEGRLSGMVVRHLMDKKGPAPLFDSGEICRGCRVIKCANQYSKEFLEKSLATVSNAWEGLSLKLIPASEIPRRPRARIWLPKMELDSSEIVPCLKLQNPEVPMDDWSVIKVEEPQQHSSAILLLINNESLEALEKQQFKLRFGLRLAKVKVFPASVALDDDLEKQGDDAKKLLDDLQLSGTDADSELGEQS
ncbi:uncharacterized protein LOC129250775 [Anastrepha obliqua]|uniref:uncharacterized protein LOC129250775 n=1 Tax=Anastrepha obliqua TaxID=95512 RepID=UPI0024097D19|nr:uncharacterized protein LOC129250775 [Anastrepha obliqua]